MENNVLNGVEWRFVTDYWDEPLAGVVEYEGRRYLAEKCFDSWQNWDGEGEEPDYFSEYAIYDAPKAYWFLQTINQILFEYCVGRHCSYPKTENYKGSHKTLYWFFYKVWKPSIGRLVNIHKQVPNLPKVGIWRV